jgi:hypothetical protein
MVRNVDSRQPTTPCYIVQGDQKVSVHLTITKQNVTSNVQSVLRLAADRQGQGDIRLTLTPSVIPNCNYVIMVSDWICLKYFCVFFVLYSSGAQRLFDHPVLFWMVPIPSITRKETGWLVMVKLNWCLSVCGSRCRLQISQYHIPEDQAQYSGA